MINSKLLRWAASLNITVVCLLLLFILVFWGTLYQVDHGLYQAQERFYNTYVFFVLDVFPFPGTQAVLTVLFFNLLASMLVHFKYGWGNMGLVVVHAGIMLLLGGGFITHQFAEESYLSLLEGEGSDVSTSYHDWELALWKKPDRPNRHPGTFKRDVQAFATRGLAAGAVLQFEQPDLKVAVDTYYSNASAFRDAIGKFTDYKSFSGIGRLQKEPWDKEPEKNIPGGLFSVQVPGKQPMKLMLYGADLVPASLELEDGTWMISLRKKRFALPVFVTLDNFKREMHPNSEIAKSFSSRIQVVRENSTRPVQISMNKPFRYKRFTLFQASYQILEDGREMSTFAVVKNYGRLLPYVASLVVFLGLLNHFIAGLLVQKQKVALIFVGVTTGWMMATSSLAETPSSPKGVTSLKEFQRVLVLENGRKMPMDSYARMKLLQFSGKSTLNRKPAIAWITRLLFAPVLTAEEKIFLINHPDVAEALSIPMEEKRLYSFKQLSGSLSKLQELALAASQIDEKERSVVEAELIRTYSNLNDYLGHLHAFQFARPHEDFTVKDQGIREKMGLPLDTDVFSFYEVFMRINQMKDVVEYLQNKEPKNWTEEEQAIFALSSNLFQWARYYQNLPVAILPVSAHDQVHWLSPWHAFSIAFQHESALNRLQELIKIHDAYRNGKQVEFDLAVRQLNQDIASTMKEDRAYKYRDLEITYNRLDLFYRSEILYGVTLLLALGTMVSRGRRIRNLALVVLGAACIIHTAGIIIRMIMMGRPPVTNLYATFLFVSWVMVILCLLIEKYQKSGLGLFCAGFAGLSLLLLSRKFVAEGDSMGVLVAVLDSNFWLSTHVVTITMGYAGCVLAGVVGHVLVLQMILGPGNQDRLQSISRSMLAILGFGLTFSFLGTMLGGIWADQSWGRFWGWDPKENGALLIVLWSAILFHARVGKIIDDLGTAVGSMLGIIVVMFAWLGVNLLGVGLHSYGFTSGLLRGLVIYVVLQCLIVVIAAPLAASRMRSQNPG